MESRSLTMFNREANNFINEDPRHKIRTIKFSVFGWLKTIVSKLPHISVAIRCKVALAAEPITTRVTHERLIECPSIALRYVPLLAFLFPWVTPQR